MCFFQQIVWHSCEPYCSALTSARRCIVPPQLSITCLLHIKYKVLGIFSELGWGMSPFGAKNAWLQFLVDTKEPSTDCLIVLLKHALCSSINCFKFLIQAHCTQMYLFMQVIFTFWKLGKGTLFTSFTFVNNIWIVKYLAEILEFQKETLI